MPDYIPSREAELLTWSVNFFAKVQAAPTDYGLTIADVTELTPLMTAFTDAYQAATDPATRTKVTVADKDVAKVALVAELRLLARKVQADPAVTAGQKTELGLPVHDLAPTPVPVPATKPVLELAGEDICRHTVRLFDEATPTSRAKPQGSAGAQVFTFIAANGENPPIELDQWTLRGLATRSEFEVVYPGADAGKKAYIAARWFNSKGEVGPRSDAVARLIAA
jgi:hypothetical protein